MGPDSPRPSTHGAVALGALVLLLCALVAATFNGPSRVGLERDDDRSRVVEEGDSRERADQRSDPEDGQPEPDDEPWLPWLPPADLLLLVPSALIFGAALLVLARLRVVRRRRRLTGRVGVRHSPVTEVAPPDEAEEPALPGALDEGARGIGEGSPRNAIVATWVRLEQAVESEHFPHRPAETPSELVERALASYHLDAEAIERLAALYREARFSRHPVTEEHRAEAAACLRRLLATLGRPGARTR
ncbi:DUF4129 domain-containing protein [Nocardioides antri]|uniref:DUF4129 domain-containing protein n=1 Tax=Nocardioides antri TaxID=2607659 RepID=A0A5B1LXA4_9ACTN|nr:DUF4129 domain-containing protein [Nocardioides antri]KAA1425605.1 DUF4129 domain-containing protein [Nocardioides antri]